MSLFITHEHSMFACRYVRYYILPLIQDRIRTQRLDTEEFVRYAGGVTARYFSIPELSEQTDPYDKTPAIKKALEELENPQIKEIKKDLRIKLGSIPSQEKIQGETRKMISQAGLIHPEKYKLALEYVDQMEMVDGWMLDQQNEISCRIDQYFGSDESLWNQDMRETRAYGMRVLSTASAWLGEYGKHRYATVLMGNPEKDGYYTLEDLKFLNEQRSTKLIEKMNGPDGVLYHTDLKKIINEEPVVRAMVLPHTASNVRVESSMIYLLRDKVY
jgi:hypothetical protein